MKQKSEKYHELVNSDLKLVRELKNQEPHAWTTIYNKYSALIKAYVISRGCDESYASDVVQETFITFNKGLDRFNYDASKGYLKAYILRIAKSKMIDIYRKNAKYTPIENNDFIQLLDIAANDNQHLTYNEMRFDIDLVDRAINKVKSRVKSKTFDCFIHAYMNEDKVKSVAADLEVSANLVSQHKHTVYNMVIREGQHSIRHDFLPQTA